jgi:hypothetical protein
MEPDAQNVRSEKPVRGSDPEPETQRGEVSAALRAQILSTEHWSLLATRSQTWSESFARAQMFLSVLSANVIALALVAQTSLLSPQRCAGTSRVHHDASATAVRQRRGPGCGRNGQQRAGQRAMRLLRRAGLPSTLLIRGSRLNPRERTAFQLVRGRIMGLGGIEPPTSSLSGIEGSALYGPAFPQVVSERQGRSYAFKRPTGTRSLLTTNAVDHLNCKRTPS